MAIEEKTKNGVPEWMAGVIPPGKYQYITKPQLEALQRPTNPLKLQVWATGILHTVGYQGELAVRLVRGKRVPFTVADIGRELFEVATQYYTEGGIPKEEVERYAEKVRWDQRDIRRAVAEIEEDGVLERKTKDGRSLRDMPK